jgi:hypothetical protein
MTKYLLFFDSYGLAFVGRPLWWEGGCAVSNISTVTLRVVRGDKKRSFKFETVKDGHESQGTWTRERLRWRGTAAYYYVTTPLSHYNSSARTPRETLWLQLRCLTTNIVARTFVAEMCSANSFVATGMGQTTKKTLIVITFLLMRVRIPGVAWKWVYMSQYVPVFVLYHLGILMSPRVTSTGERTDFPRASFQHIS